MTFSLEPSPNPSWQPGSGANLTEWKNHRKIELNPNERPSVDNYRTLISAVVPRPIALVSTIGADGTKNLAPFSYFSVAHSDPPIFTIGISGSSKDTFVNVQNSGELTISIISEWFAEAANYTNVNAPAGVDEWQLSGLTPAPSAKVAPPHVAELAFSIEAKLVHVHEWKSAKDKDRVTGHLLIVEGVNFHVREDVQTNGVVDFAKLQPVARLGGISYGLVESGFELPRVNYDDIN